MSSYVTFMESFVNSDDIGLTQYQESISFALLCYFDTSKNQLDKVLPHEKLLI